VGQDFGLEGVVSFGGAFKWLIRFRSVNVKLPYSCNFAVDSKLENRQ
jgi:hypothetical protein